MEENLGTAYLVSGTTELERCGLSNETEGDFPSGPRKTWANREPLLSVKEGRVMLRDLERKRSV